METYYLGNNINHAYSKHNGQGFGSKCRIVNPVSRKRITRDGWRVVDQFTN